MEQNVYEKSENISNLRFVKSKRNIDGFSEKKCEEELKKKLRIGYDINTIKLKCNSNHYDAKNHKHLESFDLNNNKSFLSANSNIIFIAFIIIISIGGFFIYFDKKNDLSKKKSKKGSNLNLSSSSTLSTNLYDSSTTQHNGQSKSSLNKTKVKNANKNNKNIKK